ncbi:uncharacterized protein LOC126843098 isoform X3 [Adelges cooleyi]|uniref:uncharacterized protein LOC126843098 isoform X3 n=1 Tax=Adelges cooleyi TaxID=133065 RepID=UPI00217F44DE|nr:uncharacterized protein LOC126843098 isoform X3 [Adelges cooleyi]
MRDLSILFFIILIMTKTSEASPDDGRHDEKSSPKITLSEEPTSPPYSPPYLPTPSQSSPTHAVSVVKCRHLSKVIKHMKATAAGFNEVKNWSSLKAEIRGYNVNKSIISLYKRDPNSIGSLWDFYLYKIWLETENIHRLETDTSKQTKVKTTHGNVIRSLENDLLRTSDCLNDNNNCPYAKCIEPANIKSIVNRNRFTLYSHVKIIDALKPTTLFVQILSIQDTRLMSFLNGNIKWTGTSQVLEKSWLGIWSEFDVTVDHYKKIKSYFTLHNHFLNIIITKLYCRHLLCMEKISDETQKLSYATQLTTLLDDYKHMLIIQDDPNVNYLSKAVEEMATKNGDIIKTTSQLKTNIESMCSVLECSGIGHITLTEYDNEIINALNTNKKIDLANSQSDEIDPLQNVKDFLDLLQELFNGLRLDVTRTFLSHIDHMLSAPDEQIMQN